VGRAQLSEGESRAVAGQVSVKVTVKEREKERKKICYKAEWTVDSGQ
jgi:hypothetical protein